MQSLSSIISSGPQKVELKRNTHEAQAHSTQAIFEEAVQGTGKEELRGIKRKREEECEQSKVARTDARRYPSNLECKNKISKCIPFQKESSITKRYFLPMQGTVYLESIEKGVKKFEGRINASTVQKMKAGDELELFDRKAKWGILCKIASKDIYYSFKDMLIDKGVLSLLPQLSNEAKSLKVDELIEKGVQIYKKFPGSNRVSAYGVAAIGVIFIKRISEQGR